MEWMVDEQPVETTVYSLGSGTPEPEERRSGDRHLSLLRVGALMIGDRRELCLIRNISAGGMLIRAYSTIEQGSRLSVELKQGEAISGVARWTKEECVGVSFDSPIDVLALISSANDGQRPRMPRIEVQCTAWVREDATVHRMKASNISQGGIRVEGSRGAGCGGRRGSRHQRLATATGLRPLAARLVLRNHFQSGDRRVGPRGLASGAARSVARPRFTRLGVQSAKRSSSARASCARTR